MVFAFLSIMTACGAKLENWPTDKFVRGVPVAQTGVVKKSIVSSYLDGNKYAVIIISDFTANDTSDYIRHILDKGWETYIEQKNNGESITYSAVNKNRDKIMHLECDISDNELTVTVEQR